MLLDRLQAEITSDFPPWTPNDGCCRQCADLDAARPLSRAEAANLPGHPVSAQLRLGGGHEWR
jgi:hypothetical protein